MNIQSTSLAVPDLACERCQQTIESALSPLPGVRRVEVDLLGKVVSVEHDPRAIAPAALARAVEDNGYAVAGYDDRPEER